MVRFLTEAAAKGGELLLYSDEPMDWMTADRTYFALWASLMARCVNSDVHIRIIHNVDRIDTEMIDAIKGWLPLSFLTKSVSDRNLNLRFIYSGLKPLRKEFSGQGNLQP